ncbi:MAG: hypothetical protein IJ822_04345 [Pyramidobacter sp.]|nr:hypothetical protein [Clostridia bacterium]MBR1895990.1 hypothetical protein [Pyramidobacter sp.]
MKGDKYLEIGNRQKIGVKRFVSPSGEARYKICQGNGVYQGSIAGEPVANKKWPTEKEAQDYLDLLAKKNNWKKAAK